MSRKSLGTLTLDLVARTGGFVQGMDKAERSSAKWRKQVERDAKAIGSAIGKTAAAAIAATTATTVALTKQGMDAVRSQADLARSLDTTFDSITALQLAAGDVGLEGLEGSLTRLNRRLGAAEVGSGAAANAVKALRLDLQALSEMDVDGRVATIADAIRDSGVSMQRAARFAQDLGFEQRQAAEFFTQGGDAIRAYRERVEALGLSLSDIDAQKVVDAQNAMGIFGDLTRGASQILAVQFSPIIQQVATDLENAAIEAGGLSDNIGEMVDTAVQGVAFVASSVDAAGRVFSTLGKTAAIIFLEMRLKSYELGDSIYNGPIEAVNELIELLNIVSWIDITPRALSGIGQQIKDEIAIIEGAIREGQQDVQDGLLSPLAGDRLIKYFEDARAAAEDAAKAGRKLRQEAGGSAPGDKPANAATADAIAKEITALERAAATWGMSANEVKLYDMTVQGATDAQLIHAQAVMKNIEVMEQQAEAAKKAIEDQKRINQEAQGIAESLLTEEEQILASYERRRQIILDNTQITGEAQTELLRRLEEDRNEQLLEINGSYWEKWLAGAEDALTSFDELAGSVVENFQTQFGGAFESMIFDAQSLDEAVAGMGESMARSVVNAIGQMIAQWLAYQAVQLLVGKTTQASAAAQITGNAYAGVMQAGINAFASTAAIPVVGPAAAPAAMTAAVAATSPMAAAASTYALLGMAHDGIDSIPQTGTWLLEKGERVTTAETSAKLDRKLDMIQTGGGGGGITINAPITVEAQPGASSEDAQKYGRQLAGAMTATVVSTLEKESRQGGLLWQLYGGGR